MAVDKAIDSTEFDSKLTIVADAIRTAGGTTATMSFPTGMVDAISSLSSGGGGTEELSALMKIFGCSDYEISVVQQDTTHPLQHINIPITNETLKSSLRLILIPGTNSLFPPNNVKKAPILKAGSGIHVHGFYGYIWPNLPEGFGTKMDSIVALLYDSRSDAYPYHTGNSFTQNGTAFLLENNLLTICFEKLDFSASEFYCSDIIGTKVLLMGGNVQ